ncbi:MAG: hypothetical protein IMX02_05360 [Limnochordaceae bacterium]|nr:hypothetical protein [Limnochordaceae bacterium]
MSTNGDDAKAALAPSDVPGPGGYLLRAADPSLVERWLDGLAGEGTERVVWFADEVTLSDMLAQLWTPPLSGAPRVFLVRHAEKMRKDDLEALVRATTGRFSFGEDRLALWDQSEEGRAAEALRQAGAFDAGTWKLVDWDSGAPGRRREQELDARLARLRLPEPALRLVKRMAMRFPERAAQELAKLEVLEGEALDEARVRAILSADLVEAVLEEEGPAHSGLGGQADRRRFQVAEAALDGDTAQAWRLARAIEREGVPASWIWREIGRQAMELWEMAEALARQAPGGSGLPEPVPEAFARRPPFAVRKAAARARRLGIEGLTTVLGWVAQTDYDSKQGVDPEDALRRLLLRMAQAVWPAP